MYIYIQSVLKTINKFNSRNAAKSINTFDYLILHTKLPHVLHKLINFYFDGGENNFIFVNYFGARWVKDKIDSLLCFSKQDIKDAVNYVPSNCYFTVGKKMFSQKNVQYTYGF